MEVLYRSLSELTPYERNPRNNAGAVTAVAESIKNFGFRVPLIIDRGGVIIAGHTRYKAAELLNIDKVPCLIADDLTPEQVKAFRLADNKVAEFAQWDFELLADELQDLTAFDVDMSAFGFDSGIFEDEQPPEDLELAEVATAEKVVAKLTFNSLQDWQKAEPEIKAFADRQGCLLSVSDSA